MIGSAWLERDELKPMRPQPFEEWRLTWPPKLRLPHDLLSCGAACAKPPSTLAQGPAQACWLERGRDERSCSCCHALAAEPLDPFGDVFGVV